MRTTKNLANAPFILDNNSVDRIDGRQIDWNALGPSFDASAFNVTLAAAASVNDVTLTVEALPYPVHAGTLLYFGESKEFARVTTFADAGATTLAVEAVPTALEDDDVAIVGRGGKKVVKAGTVMCELSTGKIVPRSVAPTEGSAVVAAKAGNTGTGTISAFTLTKAAKPGVYTLTIIEPGTDAGKFSLQDPDGIELPTGTVAVAYSAGGLAFTVTDATDFASGDQLYITVTKANTAMGLLATAADEESESDSLSGYGVLVGGVFYENLLPDATGTPKVLDPVYKAELQAAGVGTGFAFRQYGDTTT